MKRSHLLIALALGACEPSPSKPNDQQARPPVVAGQHVAAPTPADPPVPEPVDAAPTFASIVNGAQVVRGKQVDAAALGDAVEVYLITRAGGPAEQDRDQAQRQDLSLVLVGASQALRFELGRHDVVVERKAPFGELAAIAPFPARRFDADDDGFYGAPAWKTKAPTLLAASIHDLSSDTLAYVVTHDRDTLVVWFAEQVWEEGSSDAWTKLTTVALARGATPTTPTPTFAAPTITDPLTVSVVEHLDGETEGSRFYALALRIGDRVGPLSEPRATADRDGGWVTGDDVPAPPPADELTAFRVYGDGPFVETVAIGRAGGDVVAWRKVAIDGEGAWDEDVRVALPAGTRLQFDTPVKVAAVTPTRRKLTATVQSEKRVDKAYEQEEPAVERDEPDLHGGVEGGVAVDPPPPPPSKP